MADSKQNDNSMSTREAGQKGGQRTSQTHGKEFYQEIGHEGGERVHNLVDKGKQVENGDME